MTHTENFCTISSQWVQKSPWWKKILKFFSKFFSNFFKKNLKKSGPLFWGLKQPSILMKLHPNITLMFLRVYFFSNLKNIYLVALESKSIKNWKSVFLTSKLSIFIFLRYQQHNCFKIIILAYAKKEFLLGITLEHFFEKKISESFFEPCNHYFESSNIQKRCF